MKLLERLKRWWSGVPVQVKPERAYSIAGWKRGADGAYRKGDASIRQLARGMWVRWDGPGIGAYGEYPTLHAAIKQELPQMDAPLLNQDGSDERLSYETPETQQ